MFIADAFDRPLAVGDEVRICCPDDFDYYTEKGKIAFIDEPNGLVLVQMNRKKELPEKWWRCGNVEKMD